VGKSPAFQFYPGDWLRDGISGCSLAAQGLWLRMMIIAHDCNPYGELSIGGIPMPHVAIARKCGCSVEEFGCLFGELTHAGVPSQKPDGTIYSRRMVRDEKLRKIRQKAGKKGGTPAIKKMNDNINLQVLVNQNPTTQVNQNPTKTPEDEEEVVVNKLNRIKKRKILSLEDYLEFAKKEIYQCLSRDRTDFKTAYPGIDLDRESAAALVWLKNNPTERKKNIGRFINNWFSRAQEKTRRPPSIGEIGGYRGTYRRPYSPRDAARSAALDDAADRINRERDEARRSRPAQNQARDHSENDAA